MGVAALSGPVDPAALEAGLAELAALGFEPVPARNLWRREGLFAGTDRERLEGFHELLADRSLRAVFFARGGHGLLRLLPAIDWSLLAREPRALVGYSDLTPLLDLVVTRLGIVAFHGPMVAVDLARGLAPEERLSLLDALAGRERLAWSGEECWHEGVARGVLRGGCLSLLAAALGGPFATSFADQILFWEEVGEPAYRLDRLLTQLYLSGTLVGLRGMAIGRVVASDGDTGWRSAPGLGGTDPAPFGGNQPPTLWGISSGHTAPNLTLPLGALVELDAGRREILRADTSEAR
ncbi:MAG: LD-carboxypeptidase [Thermoanaerobaculia bacterium]|nr:LD-carboxypeptidase [Thermoanaerobaculia bacterium]